MNFNIIYYELSSMFDRKITLSSLNMFITFRYFNKKYVSTLLNIIINNDFTLYVYYRNYSTQENYVNIFYYNNII